ncbi:MAG: hypothetical protein PF638_11525 [Candidatus Delongbacteria bacterium]|jgi:hypothetical protein|nr:hypothetical protein [Candidatus Delongbacteria bacterium]
MKNLLFIFVFLILIALNANSVLLKDKTITVETTGIAILGNGITIEDAKIFAINDAKLNALEMVGTYLESNTTILNHMVTKDEIKTFTGSVLKTVIKDEEKCMIDKNFVFKVTINAVIDSELLNKRIEEVRRDSQLKSRLEKESKKVEELTLKIAELQNQKGVTKEQV